jgi:hypothetical protein
MKVTRIGLDIAKQIFELHGITAVFGKSEIQEARRYKCSSSWPGINRCS